MAFTVIGYVFRVALCSSAAELQEMLLGSWVYNEDHLRPVWYHNLPASDFIWKKSVLLTIRTLLNDALMWLWTNTGMALDRKGLLEGPREAPLVEPSDSRVRD